jgi:uncharacterized membrane protein YeaQ/YmgE (transglycosylase-associated protein family)
MSAYWVTVDIAKRPSNATKISGQFYTDSQRYQVYASRCDHNKARYAEEPVMHMSGESLLVILLVGAIAGWLAGQIVQGTGFGLVGDIIIGIVGAFIASWLFPQLGIHLGVGIVAAIIAATIGAVLLLVIVRLVRRGGRW